MHTGSWRAGAKFDEWRDEAQCRKEAEAGLLDPAVFFPTSRHDERTAEAKAVCGRCPVSEGCLAANMGTEGGTYGGLTEWERSALARSRRKRS